jgi:carboxyl-terminal processing protease
MPEKRPRFLSELQERALIAGVSILAVLAAFEVGQAYQQHKHPQSLVDQAITRVTSGDPGSPQAGVLNQAAIEAILKATGDQWSNYFPATTASAFDQSLDGQYSGVGIWLRKSESGLLEVSSVQPKSPAAIAKVQVLDQLTNIDGVDVSGNSVSTAIAALRGVPGSTVTLDFVRNKIRYRIQVVRSNVLTGDVTAVALSKNIVDIQVSAISMHTADDVAAALAKFSHSKGVVLDLRDNPGGLLSQAVSIASQFLLKGTVVSYDPKDGPEQILRSTNISPDPAPLVVLINKGTASSAEIIAGALQDRNRAVIIGTRSYGKGTVQEITTLSDGSQLEITVANYKLPSGRTIDRKGITPDLEASGPGEIAKAVSILGGLTAGTK